MPTPTHPLTLTMRPLSSTFTMLALAALSFVSLVLGTIGLGTDHWFETNWRNISTTSGLFKSCVTGRCDNIKFTDQICVTGAARSGSEMEMRYKVTTAMIIVGLIFALAVSILSSVAATKRNAQYKRTGFVIIVICIILSMVTYTAGIVLYIYTVDDWLNCERNFCDGKLGCSSKFGFSFILVTAALALSFVAHLTTLIALMLHSPQINVILPPMTNAMVTVSAVKDDEKHVEPPKPFVNTDNEYSFAAERGDDDASDCQYNPTESTTSNTHPPQEYVAVDEMGAKSSDEGLTMQVDLPPKSDGHDDEWKYDEANNLWWSDLQHLYLDTDSNQYYDPASGQWYNPDKGEWYTLANG